MRVNIVSWKKVYSFWEILQLGYRKVILMMHKIEAGWFFLDVNFDDV